MMYAMSVGYLSPRVKSLSGVRRRSRLAIRERLIEGICVGRKVFVSPEQVQTSAESMLRHMEAKTVGMYVGFSFNLSSFGM